MSCVWRVQSAAPRSDGAASDQRENMSQPERSKILAVASAIAIRAYEPITIERCVAVARQALDSFGRPYPTISILSATDAALMILATEGGAS